MEIIRNVRASGRVGEKDEGRRQGLQVDIGGSPGFTPVSEISRVSKENSKVQVHEELRDRSSPRAAR